MWDVRIIIGFLELQAGSYVYETWFSRKVIQLWGKRFSASTLWGILLRSPALRTSIIWYTTHTRRKANLINEIYARDKMLLILVAIRTAAVGVSPKNLIAPCNSLPWRLQKTWEKGKGWVWLAPVHTSSHPQSSPFLWLQSLWQRSGHQGHLLGQKATPSRPQ